VAAFATLVSTYMTGFTVLFEPFDETAAAGATCALLTLSCMDATIAMRPVLSRFKSVIITSGTLSPLDMYPRLLDFTPAIQASLSMTMVRDTISPLIVTRGADQVAVSTRFEIRNDPAVVRNYGQLLVEMCKVVPDGLVCFFPSYNYLETIVAMWSEMGIIGEVAKIRL
jgi:DNA excision repair protein ERCC-2